MVSHIKLSIFLVVSVFSVLSFTTQPAQSTLPWEISYQGRLEKDGQPVSGSFDMRFLLFDASSGGSQIGFTLTRSAVEVSSGIFTVYLDFPQGVYSSNPLYLQIEVRQTGTDEAFSILTPRSPLTASPFAMKASSLHLPFNGIITLPGAAALSITNESSSSGAWGIFVETAGINGSGVIGRSRSLTGTNYGGYFVSNSTEGRGVLGWSTSNSGSGYGVYGIAAGTSATGVFGWASSTSGNNTGVVGQSDSTSGVGVEGWVSSATGNNIGVLGQSASDQGTGVFGRATAQSGFTYGVYGESNSNSGAGMAGYATALSGVTDGVYGQSASNQGVGVSGRAIATTGNTAGVFGQSDSLVGTGVYGLNTSAIGYGVYSHGRFAASGLKSFQIDHPSEPASKYLNHYCAEGPEPLNIYRGTVSLNDQGEAWVSLPDYFESLNTDFTYQLTPIGAPMPGLYIADEVSANRFRIAGGQANARVSWVVTGVRNDAWVQHYGAPVEVAKSKHELGRFLHPELYGQPAEAAILPASRTIHGE